MKKVLLAGTALVGLAFASSPASAEINLDLGGYFKGYGVYSDDESAAGNLREFNVRRNAEIHFTGETTTDNGLTVGVHHELRVDDPVGSFAASTGVQSDESYMYMSGGWGRVNFGKEDGAAYLLQIAAPSADSNIDGMRVFFQAYDPYSFNTTLGAAEAYDYQHADFRQNNRLTYLTPKFNGFQGGVSWAPEDDSTGPAANLLGMATDNDADEFDNLWEIAARWDGEFEGFGISAGAGYSDANLEAAGTITDDVQTWNAGLNVAFQGFSIGGAYRNTETGADLSGLGLGLGNTDVERDTWVVGGAYDNGPYHVGVSYLNTEYEVDAVAGEYEVERWTAGGGYTYGPGMTFRGAVAFGDGEVTGAADEDFTQVTIGTDVQF